MKKAPEAFRTISEVAEILDTPAHVLRFWESKFYQIRPVKRAGGRRYYRPDDVALINGIKALLQDQGMTIRGVQRVLQEQGVKHVASLGGPLAEPADEDDLIADAGDFREELPPPHEDAVEVPDRTEIPGPATLSADEPAAPPYFSADDQPPEFEAEFDDAGEQARQPVDEAFAPEIAAFEPPPTGTTIEDDVEPAEMLDTEILGAPDIAPDEIRDAPDSDAPGSVAIETAPPAAAKTPAPAVSAAAVVESDEALAELREPSERALLARRLRTMPRGGLGPRRGRAELLSHRIDALLERMSEASGAGRW